MYVIAVLIMQAHEMNSQSARPSRRSHVIPPDDFEA